MKFRVLTFYANEFEDYKIKQESQCLHNYVIVVTFIIITFSEFPNGEEEKIAAHREKIK